MPEPIDINRTLTRIQHLERARDLYADENRRLNELMLLADKVVTAVNARNAIDLMHACKHYLDARQGPNP